MFHINEGQTVTVPGTTTTGNVTFTWTNTVLSGIGGLSNTYARIRVSTDTGMSTATSGGAFKDGEVEDYLIPFNTPLPLQLVDISGQVNGQTVLLNWHSTDEYNIDNYQIQMSENATQFYTIGSVRALNEPSNNYKFSYTLPDDIKKSYFRLKMNDIDGTANTSRTISLNVQEQEMFEGNVSPNPIISELKFVYENTLGDFELEMEVYDLTGKLLMRRIENMQKGNNIIRWGMSDLAQGVYILRYEEKVHLTNGIIKFSVTR